MLLDLVLHSDRAALKRIWRLNPPYLLRGLQKGKRKKKTWYQYIFGEIAPGKEPTVEKAPERKIPTFV